SVSAPPLAMRATDIASSAVAHTAIVDVDQNGWESKIERAWGALGGIATLEGENGCAHLRSVFRSPFCSRLTLTRQTTRKPRAGPTTSPPRRRILRRLSPPRVADGDLIAGPDSRASVAVSAAGVVAAGKRSKNGAAAAGGPTICGFSAAR